MSSQRYWVWLATLGGVGTVTTATLIDHFGSPDKVFEAGANEYRDVEGVSATDITRLMNKNLDIADTALSSCNKIGCRVMTLHDADYPERLRNIYNPPIVLYIKGDLPHIDEEPVVAIAGTRRCTPYGVSVADKIGCRLAQCGLTVVTGLAKGVDSAATRGALRSGNCMRRVVGVVGSGLDIVYPKENKALFDDVIRNGAIISEYAPGTPPLPWHFPARNRILSGLSLGVAIIEAPKRSGALITASRALEQGRDVFSLPGNVDARNNEGSNALLRDGAIPIMSGDDIISEYAELYPDKIDTKIVGTCPKKWVDNKPSVEYIDLATITDAQGGDERVVVKTIGADTLATDDIIIIAGLSAPRVLSALTILEINGSAVRDMSGKWKLR